MRVLTNDRTGDRAGCLATNGGHSRAGVSDEEASSLVFGMTSEITTVLAPLLTVVLSARYTHSPIEG